MSGLAHDSVTNIKTVLVDGIGTVWLVLTNILTSMYVLESTKKLVQEKLVMFRGEVIIRLDHLMEI